MCVMSETSDDPTPPDTDTVESPAPKYGSLEWFEHKAATALRRRRRYRNAAIATSLTYIIGNAVIDWLNIAEDFTAALILIITTGAVALACGMFVGKYTAWVDIHRRDNTYLELAQATTPGIAMQALRHWLDKDNEPVETTGREVLVIDGLFNQQTQELNVWDRFANPKPGFHATINLAPDTNIPTAPDTSWIKTQTQKERDKSG